MGFDLGATVNSAADWLCSAPIVRSVINNPIFTALLVTALAAIIIMALYGSRLKGTGFKRGARAFLYVFMAVTAVLFVHHYAVMRCARREATQKGVRDVFSSIQQSRQSGLPGVPIMPTEGYEGYEGDSAAAPVAAAPVTGGYTDSASPQGYALRPDNISLDSDLIIEDVVVPRTRQSGLVQH
jgi:hypothetical protein